MFVAAADQVFRVSFTFHLGTTLLRLVLDVTRALFYFVVNIPI
jgi:hypothetical protein